MSKDIVESIFGWLGSIISIYFFIAPIYPFTKVLLNKIDYNDSPGILLLFTFMNCILWTVYGFLKDETQIYITNSLGGVITLIWITIYLIYLGKKYFVFSFIINIFLLILIISISHIFYHIVGEDNTGLIAMIFNVLMFAAPGEKIFQVFKTGKFELIPIFSSIGGFACSLCWLIFGIYKKDLNIIIPNSIGLLFAIFQIIIYLIYNKKNKTK